MAIETANSRPPLSRKKRILFSIAGTLVGLALAEVCAGVWLANYYQFDSFQRVRSNQAQLAEFGISLQSGNESIHPYLGWVMNPNTGRGSELGGRTIPVNSLGFNDEEFAIPKRGRDRLIVGVLGGSVAWQMTVLGEAKFREALQQNPRWRNREIQIVRLAMPGYKQPQQLMTLNFLLALGAEFDVIVNIDGYNEIALGACENFEAGIYVAYPRMWSARIQDVVDPRNYSRSFRILEIKATRQRLAQQICGSRFRWSRLYNLVWQVRDAWQEKQLVAIGDELLNRRLADGRGFAADGPKPAYGNDETAMADSLRGIWSSSSLQMRHLCSGNGIKYVHILQPNQYLPGSKPMSGRERKDIFDEGQCYGQAIAKYYPLLIRESEELRKSGVDVHDLTMLFAEIEEPIYADPFCHYNVRGNELLAQTVAAKIIGAFQDPE